MTMNPNLSPAGDLLPAGQQHTITPDFPPGTKKRRDRDSPPPIFANLLYGLKLGLFRWYKKA